MPKIENIARPGMTGYIQTADVARYLPSTLFDGRACEKYEVWHGAYWQGAGSSDAKAGRERMEFRSETLDPVGALNSYRWLHGVAADYPFMEPKQTLGQYFDGKKGYPLWWFDLRGPVMSLFLNSYISAKRVIPIPQWQAGKLNAVEVRQIPAPGPAAYVLGVLVNGREVIDERLSLMEPDGGDLHFKYGIYRSSMDDWQAAHPGETAPVQRAYWCGVERFAGGLPGETPAPVVVAEPTPAPVQPQPAPVQPQSAPILPRMAVEFVDAAENLAKDALAECKRADLPHTELGTAAVKALTEWLKAMKEDA